MHEVGEVEATKIYDTHAATLAEEKREFTTQCQRSRSSSPFPASVGPRCRTELTPLAFAVDQAAVYKANPPTISYGGVESLGFPLAVPVRASVRKLAND